MEAIFQAWLDGRLANYEAVDFLMNYEDESRDDAERIVKEWTEWAEEQAEEDKHAIDCQEALDTEMGR